jgi:hypothetical protein
MSINRASKVLFSLCALIIASITASFVTGAATRPADLSYNSVEEVRASRLFASVPDLSSYDAIENLRLFRAPMYWEYDQIERIRLQRTLGLIEADSSYDLVERVRTMRGQVADRSYDNIEAIRLLR